MDGANHLLFVEEWLFKGTWTTHKTIPLWLGDAGLNLLYLPVSSGPKAFQVQHEHIVHWEVVHKEIDMFGD